MDIIKEDVFRKQLKKGLSGGYLFFGEEDYLKSFALKSAREAICTEPTFAVFNDVRIDAIDYTSDVLINALMPPPMMCEQKLVSVSGLAFSDMKPSELDALYEALSLLEEYDYNVLIISVPSGLMDEGNPPKRPSTLFNELCKYLTPVQFDAISGTRLAAWVGKHFEHHGVTATPSLCNMLIERVGRSMFTLSAETEKIAYYVLSHSRTEVTAADIEGISASVIDSDAYALTNAILDSKYSEAMDALSVMKLRRVEPVIILSEVSRTLCDMMAVKALLTEGLPIAEAARILKMNEYRAKLYGNSVTKKSEQKLKRALLLCSEADLALKLSPQGYSAIERLICCL